MHLKTIIYTTSKVPQRDLDAIKDTLAYTKGVSVEKFTVVKVPSLTEAPTYTDGGTFIKWDWLKDAFPAGDHNAVCVHLTPRERDLIGLKHPDTNALLGGVYHMDPDGVFDFVVIADHRQMSYDGMSEFERIFLHELSHGFYHWRGVEDYTHLWDYVIKSMRAPYMTHDFTLWNQLKDRLQALQKRLADMQKKLHAPLDEQFMGRMTQGFGVPNATYPQTRHHVGTDWSCPSGEKAYAIADGVVVRTFRNHAQMGHAFEYEFTHAGTKYTARYMHLSRLPDKIGYKAGETIAYTGNTGQTTGPHLHLDIVRGVFDLTGVNHLNFREKFVDPLTLI